MSKILLILVIISSVSSCSSVKVCEKPPLPLPPPIPPEKVLNQAELSCVTDETLQKVILIDKKLKTCKNIIKSTHE